MWLRTYAIPTSKHCREIFGSSFPPCQRPPALVVGQPLALACGPTRTKADFLAHLQAMVENQPEMSLWHIVCGQLNTHQSESLVRWVAKLSGVEEDLGVKGKSGPLASMSSWATFLSDPTRHLWCSITRRNTVAFLYQIEIWLSIPVRKLLRRAHSPLLRTRVCRSSLLLTITIARWSSPSSGPIKARF